jgi:hypothetical protein
VNAKSNPDSRWWVETSVKRPKSPTSQGSNASAPVGARFYAVANGYNQEQAKEHLTDNNLRLARQADPPPGDWAYVALTDERSRDRILSRLRREFTMPKQARGVIIDHGRLARLLICGPQLEDWMIDVRLASEASIDVYVWGTLYRERLFKRSRDALRQAQQWVQSLLAHPPSRDDAIRGAVL